MQTSTIIVLACLIAAAMASIHEQYQYPAVESVQESMYNTPVHDRSPRTKRGLLLLKKKLLLGNDLILYCRNTYILHYLKFNLLLLYNAYII